MSRKRSESEYEKTLSFRLKQWLAGTKDPFLGTLEMKARELSEGEKVRIEKEEQQRAQKYHEEKKTRVSSWVYNSRRNRDVRVFRGIYRACAALFCVFLLLTLLTAVSWLPTEGLEDRPVNNEVSARYIESGLQETGAVNIVTGMILDYRAFDTLGESHVLFAATMTVLILLRLDRDEDKKSSMPTIAFMSRKMTWFCRRSRKFWYLRS